MPDVYFHAILSRYIAACRQRDQQIRRCITINKSTHRSSPLRKIWDPGIASANRSRGTGREQRSGRTEEIPTPRRAIREEEEGRNAGISARGYLIWIGACGRARRPERRAVERVRRLGEQIAFSGGGGRRTVIGDPRIQRGSTYTGARADGTGLVRSTGS